MNLESAIAKKCWSPRAAFPPSSPLGDRLFTCGGGFYLMTNSDFGEGDPGCKRLARGASRPAKNTQNPCIYAKNEW